MIFKKYLPIYQPNIQAPKPKEDVKQVVITPVMAVSVSYSIQLYLMVFYIIIKRFCDYFFVRNACKYNIYNIIVDVV